MANIRLKHTLECPMVTIFDEIPQGLSENELMHRYGYAPLTILNTAHQLNHTIQQFTKHSKQRGPLHVMFARAATWQYEQLLDKALEKIRNVLEPIMDEDFTGKEWNKQEKKLIFVRRATLNSNPTTAATIRTIFDEARKTLDAMKPIMMGLTFIASSASGSKDSMVTRPPRGILLEIFLQNKLGKPTPAKLKTLVDGGNVLDLDFASPCQDKFVVKKKHFPSNGIPRMHFVSINRWTQSWLVGSTAGIFTSLEGAQKVIKNIREIDIGPYYRELCAKTSDRLESRDPKSKDKGANLAARKRFITEIKATIDYLGRSKDYGIALDSNLSLQLNCYRCRASFGYIETPQFSRDRVDESIQEYIWDVKKEKHACAEVVASLRGAVASFAATQKAFE